MKALSLEAALICWSVTVWHCFWRETVGFAKPYTWHHVMSEFDLVVDDWLIYECHQQHKGDLGKWRNHMLLLYTVVRNPACFSSC